MKTYIGIVTYYGEYRNDIEPHVTAENDQEALQKCFDWCKGMRQDQLSIKVYPYVNGYKD